MTRHGVLLWVSIGGFLSAPVYAVNPEFQRFFFDACVNPSGTLAVRCSETPAAAGDLSGSSESSLNPSQTLGSTETAVAEARARGTEARERVERYRRSEDDADASRVSLGPVSLLLNGRREWEERDRKVDIDAERGFESDRRAIEVGLDRRFSDSFVAGLLYGFEDASLEFDPDVAGVNFTPASNAGSIDREAHSVTVFAVLQLSQGAYLEANAGYAGSDYLLTRNAVFQESTRSVSQTHVRTRARTKGDQLWLGVTAGYQWNSGASDYGIYAGGTYTESRLDGYRERDPGNSGLALVVDDVERDALSAHVGFRAQRAIGVSYGVWVPQLRLEYEHTGRTDQPQANVRFALDGDGNQFALEGESSDDRFNMGVGVAAIFPNGWISFVDVEGLAGARDRQQYRFTVGIRKEL